LIEKGEDGVVEIVERGGVMKCGERGMRMMGGE
jgi:hypothetical protein